MIDIRELSIYDKISGDEPAWFCFLNYLQNEDNQDCLNHSGFRKSDIKIRTVWQSIDELADLKDSYIDYLIKDTLRIAKENNWEEDIIYDFDNKDYFWNESMAQAIYDYVKGFDPEGRKAYEDSGYLVDENGNINKELLKGSISIEGGVSFRIKDMKRADAGANFEQVLKYVNEEPIIYDNILNPWVIPWYNINGHSYSKVRGHDKEIAALGSKYKLNFTRTQDVEDTTANQQIEKWIRLLMPQYKRRVEVEDLDRNFWVIAQVITGISAYLFDKDSPLTKALSAALNEVTQLWENVLYMWVSLAALASPYYENVHTEVVYIPNNISQPFYKYDSFCGQYPDEETLQFKRNEVEKYLQYYIDVYTDDNLCLIPVVRRKNKMTYGMNSYNIEDYLGIYTYNRNTKEKKWSPLAGKDFFSVQIDNYLSNLCGINEEEAEYTYFAPMSKKKDFGAEGGYLALMRTKVTFGELPHIQDNEIVWSGDSIEVCDAAQEILFDNSQYYPLSTFSTISPDIEIARQKIHKGFYRGEMLSTLKNFSVNWNIEVRTIELMPFTEKDITDQVKDYRLLTDDSFMNVIEHKAMEYISELDKSKIYLFVGTHLRNARILSKNIAEWKNQIRTDSNFVSMEEVLENSYTEIECQQLTVAEEPTASSATGVYIYNNDFYYVNPQEPDPGKRVVKRLKRDFYDYDKDNPTIIRKYSVGVIIEDDFSRSAVLYLPFNIENKFLPVPQYYYFSQNFFPSLGGFGLSNAQVRIFYQGNRLMKDNWVIEFTRFNGTAFNANNLSEIQQKWGAVIDMALPYSIDGVDYRYAVIKSISTSYFYPNGDYAGREVRRISETDPKLSTTEDFQWRERPDLNKYVLKDMTLNGIISTHNFKTIDGKRVYGVYAEHWRDGFTGEAIADVITD